jgi:hypothetical protein
MIFLEFDGSFGEPEERREGPIADMRGSGPLLPQDRGNSSRDSRGEEAGSGQDGETEG